MKSEQIAECSICRKPFIRQKPLQSVCSFDCAVRISRQSKKARQEAEKGLRAQFRKRKEAAKPRRKWLDEAQKEINKYVRLRDAHLPCVSCGMPASWGGQWHASHFRSVAAASAVRYNLWNIHKSCSVCNNWKSGNLSEYEPRLRERIGNAKVDWLRQQNKVISYDINYLKRLKSVFQKRSRRLEARDEQG